VRNPYLQNAAQIPLHSDTDAKAQGIAAEASRFDQQTILQKNYNAASKRKQGRQTVEAQNHIARLNFPPQTPFGKQAGPERRPYINRSNPIR
jgi:hypothetical protein